MMFLFVLVAIKLPANEWNVRLESVATKQIQHEMSETPGFHRVVVSLAGLWTCSALPTFRNNSRLVSYAKDDFSFQYQGLMENWG
jgi:hypothetical protein